MYRVCTLILVKVFMKHISGHPFFNLLFYKKKQPCRFPPVRKPAVPIKPSAGLAQLQPITIPAAHYCQSSNQSQQSSPTSQVLSSHPSRRLLVLLNPLVVTIPTRSSPSTPSNLYPSSALPLICIAMCQESRGSRDHAGSLSNDTQRAWLFSTSCSLKVFSFL